MSQKDKQDVVPPVVALLNKSPIASIVLGGASGIGNWFLIKRYVPRLHGFYRLLFSWWVFSFTEESTLKWGATGFTYFFRRHLEEQARRKEETQRKSKRHGEAGNRGSEQPT